MTEKRIVCITDVCSSIFAGGDAPKKHFSFEQTEECCYPVFSNGENNNGLYGYTNTARVTEPSITVSARGTIGFTAIRLTPFTPIVRLISITPIQDIIDIDYLYYALSNYTPENTGTSIPQLTVPMIKKYIFRLPEKDEQKRAVKVLKQIDNILEKEKKQIQKLDELIKSRFVEMFGDPIANDRVWNKSTLNDVCDGIGDGLHGTPEYDDSGNYPFINGNNLIDGEIAITSATKYVNGKTYNKHKIEFSSNTILLSINGTLGKIAYYHGEEIMLGKSACYINLTSRLNRVFVFWLMRTPYFRKFLDENSTKSTIKNVGLKTIRGFEIILPPIEMQNQFAEYVKQVEKTKSALKQSIEKLETLKKSLMQEYFG